MAKPKRDLRALYRAARDGDYSAARALLKLYGYGQIAAEIKPGKPFSNRARTAIGAITAGIDTEWEDDLMRIQPSPRMRPRNMVFED